MAWPPASANASPRDTLHFPHGVSHKTAASPQQQTSRGCRRLRQPNPRLDYSGSYAALKRLRRDIPARAFRHKTARTRRISPTHTTRCAVVVAVSRKCHFRGLPIRPIGPIRPMHTQRLRDKNAPFRGAAAALAARSQLALGRGSFRPRRPGYTFTTYHRGL
jgi:hypothetical protein